MTSETRERPTQLLKIAEAASQLACSTRTVWQLIALGRLTAIKIGTRSTRVEAAEVESFIAEARRRTKG